MLKSLTWNDLLQRFKAVIFDMDGVLFDTIGVWNEADRRIIMHFSGHDITDLVAIQNDRDSFLKNYKGTGAYLAYIQFLVDKYGLVCDSAEEVLNYKWDLAGQILSNLDFKPGALEFIQALQKAGVIIALATNSTQKQLDDLFVHNHNVSSKLKLDSFNVILRKEDCEKSKPDPEIYQKTLDRLNLSATQCLIVEDSYEGVCSAINAGIPVINIYDVYSDVNRKKINEALNVTNIETFIVKSFEELLP